MDSQTALPLATTAPRRVLLAGAIWLAVYFAARYALTEIRMGEVPRLAASFAPLFAFGWFVWVAQQAVKRADELQRLIQLQALAMAFSTAMIVLMTLGLLEIFHEGRLTLPPFRDLWALLPAIYAICLAVAWHRFR
jgi:nicotinamide riboside transporter PnuC